MCVCVTQRDRERQIKTERECVCVCMCIVVVLLNSLRFRIIALNRIRTLVKYMETACDIVDTFMNLDMLASTAEMVG